MYVAREDRLKRVHPIIPKNFEQAHNALVQFPMGPVLPYYSAYRTAVARAIEQSTESGLYVRANSLLDHKTKTQDTLRNFPKYRFVSILSLHNLVPVLVVWATGLLVASVVLCVELVEGFVKHFRPCLKRVRREALGKGSINN